MKINKLSDYTIFFIVVLLITSSAWGQLPKLCGKYQINRAAGEKAESFMRSNSTLAVNRMVRVFFHVFRNDDGTNAAATEAQIQSEFDELVADYAPDNLCFANMGFEFINNTFMNTQVNPDIPNEGTLFGIYLVPDCINVFYHKVLINYGGNAYSIPNTFCSVDDGNLGFWHTTSHEVGHCLGLMHTFETANGMENINGSNCSIAGDAVCDTNADPYNFRGSSCFSNSGCLYTGNCPDPRGDTTYSPPYNNIMSYWGVVGCNLTTFTPGQYARANAFLSTDAGLLATQSPSSLVYGPANITSGNEMQSAIFGVTTSGSVFLGGTVRASLQGQSVILNPGFIASPSNGSILIRVSTCSY